MKKYSNPHFPKTRRNLFHVVLWKSGYYNDTNKPLEVPSDFSYPLPKQVLKPNAPKAMWINHSTFLVSVGNVNFLTDPIWSQRCSPLSFFGPKRRHLPPISLEELPQIDYVLISHDHYDHLDRKTVIFLHRRFPRLVWLVPMGVKKWFTKLGIHNVHELNWWDEIRLESQDSKTKVKATFVPAQHFSGRKLRHFNQTLWGGWVIDVERGESHKRFYFVGDTGYNSYDFKKIGEKWKQMDLSLIPIGSYSPRKFMSPIHIEPKDAVRIHLEVGSRLSLAMHWKTFHLGDESLNQPPYDLFLALQEKGIDPMTFLAVEPGKEINF